MIEDQYEIKLVHAKIDKPERYKDSEFFVMSDVKDIKEICKIISEKQYKQILEVLEE